MCIREWIWKDTEERERALGKQGTPLPSDCDSNILYAPSVNRLHCRTEKEDIARNTPILFL